MGVAVQLLFVLCSLLDQYGLITVKFCHLHCVESKVDPITVVAAVEIISLNCKQSQLTSLRCQASTAA